MLLPCSGRLNPDKLGLDASQKNSATVGGGAKFSLNADFSRQFDEWMDAKNQEQRKTDGGYFRVGTTSAALKSIGVRDGASYWRKQKIGCLMSDHPEIDAQTAKSVPYVIERHLDRDKKRTDTWLMSLGVQFPSDQPMYGSMGSISCSGQNVKITGETFSSIVRKGAESMEMYLPG